MSFSANIRSYLVPALMAVALLVLLLKPANINLQTVAQSAESELNIAEEVFSSKVKSKELWQALREKKFESDEFQKLVKKGVQISYYKNDSLLFWSDNSAFLLTPADDANTATTLVKLKNGWFQQCQFTDKATHETLIGLVRVKYDYPFENKFLKNAFAFSFRLPDNLQLSEQKIDGGVPVKNLSGTPLFYLYLSGDVKEAETDIILLLAQLLFFLIAAFYLNKFCLQAAGKKGFVTGFGGLVLVLVVARAAMLYFKQPAEFYKLQLFDPKFYASSVVTPSLGDLLLNLLFLLWMVVFFIKHKPTLPNAKKLSFGVSLLLVAGVHAVSLLVWWLFKTLVIDSVVSFEVYNILGLNAYSLLGLFCMALMMALHLVVVKFVHQYVNRNNVSLGGVALLLGLVVVALLSVVIQNFYFESLIFTVVWTASMYVVFFLLFNTDITLSARNIIGTIVLYSLFSTFLIENLYEKKERNQRVFFSGKLVSEHDYVAEYLFEDVAKRVSEDAFLKSYFSNPLITKKQLTDRIASLYMGGYFDRYALQVFSFDAAGVSLKNDDTAQTAVMRALLAESLREGTLIYSNDTAQNYFYLARLSLMSDTTEIGSLCLKLSPKIYYGQNVYPELLLSSNISSGNNPNNYSYAIYQSDKLIAQSGDFPYSYYWNKAYDFEGKDFRFIEEADWEHGIQQFTNGKKVLVSVKREPEFEPIATFSYFFTFYFTIVTLFLLTRQLARGESATDGLFSVLSLSFRTRINYSMLLMILVSFIIIGFITISFFSRQYDSFYTDRLLRKERVVHAGLEYFVQQHSANNNLLQESLNRDLEIEVARQAEINSIDINIYDRSGVMKVASQPAIYSKGLVSKLMNPSAYFDLENHKTAQVTKQERIGALSYLATYAPIRNNQGDAIAYLGIPYFERSKNIDNEVSSFLVALMNVYVFLLICAAILAYLVSNSITRPLTIISEKLRILNLNKVNEPIEWNSNDEIGVLVNEYNKMINELEQSAQKLAKSEREGAWREMAKQIAHEIKNPLTPMKLSIQYLQRAIDEGHTNIEQLAQKVAKTLEEQIENLSSIATAFSSFAKMPKAQNEIIELNELLRSIVHLFGNEDAQVTFTTSVAHPTVFADKNQLVSVFNNLVKNAIQSIPENRKGFVDVHVKQEEDWVVVAVSDNGVGIAGSHYENVFVPNFTTKSSGTGLGLAITKQIVDGAGGKIWFESEENVGSTFTVKLAVCKA